MSLLLPCQTPCPVPELQPRCLGQQLKTFNFIPAKFRFRSAGPFPLSVPNLMKQFGCRDRVEQNPREWRSQSDQPKMSQSFNYFGKVKGEVRSSAITPGVTLKPSGFRVHIFVCVCCRGGAWPVLHHRIRDAHEHPADI